jgi:hypothetical protein
MTILFPPGWDEKKAPTTPENILPIWCLSVQQRPAAQTLLASAGLALSSSTLFLLRRFFQLILKNIPRRLHCLVTQ